MTDERKYCRKCGKPINSDAKFCRYCGYNFEKAPPPGRKKKGFGRVAVAVALLIVIAFVYPGWLKKDRNGKIEYKRNSEVITVSPENLEAKTKSGVSVRLTEYAVDEETELTVESMEPVYAENGDYVIKPFEVSLGDIHQMDDFVEIRIPYNTSFCDKGEKPAECVGGVYYNENSKEWEETLYTVDEKTGEVVIRTNHFSKFGAMTIKNKGKRNAYLSGLKTDNNGDLSIIDEDKAISVMSQLVKSYGEESSSAKLVGNEVLQAVMSLGGAASTMSDVAGNTFNIACYLDISDFAMQGRYVEQGYVLFPHHGHYETVGFSNNFYQTYNRGMIDRSGEILSNVGIAISGCKLAAMIGKASAGKASDAEILNMYKDVAGLSVSIGGSATLGALMGPVWIADQFINYCYEEGMQIKQDQMAEMYEFFNYRYEGSPELNIRAGRNLKDWRARIIQLIDENPDEDSADLLRDEVDAFAEDFWKLNAVEIDNVAGSAPKKYMRIPFDDAKLRKTLTDDYKKQLYKELQPVMTSVRNYYTNKLQQEAQKTIERAKRYYNREIEFTITQPYEQGKKPEFAGCTVVFAPLRADADLDSWKSTIPDNGDMLYGEFTLLGHILAGCPNTLLVFDKKANIQKDEPILSVPVEIKDYKCNIVLESKKEEKTDIEEYTGTWYDESGMPQRIKDLGDGVIGHCGYLESGDWIEWKYKVEQDGYKLLLSDSNSYDGKNYYILSKDRQTMTVIYGSTGHVFTRYNPADNYSDTSPENPFSYNTLTEDPYAHLIPEGDND